MTTSLTVDPKKDFLREIYNEKKYDENARWILYYHRMIEALDVASNDGLFVTLC